jgi:tetratricopeptide (TPR) repeat protein
LSEEKPFASLQGISEEDAAELATLMEEARERYRETKDPSEMLGLKGLGATDEAVQAAIGLGAQLVQQGLLDKAFEYFAGLQQIEQVNYEVYRWLGYIQHLKKNYVLAYQMYQLAMAFNPLDPVTRINMGECMLMIDESPVAGMFQVQEGIELAEKNPRYAPYVKRGEQLLIAAKERVDIAARADTKK